MTTMTTNPDDDRLDARQLAALIRGDAPRPDVENDEDDDSSDDPRALARRIARHGRRTH